MTLPQRQCLLLQGEIDWLNQQALSYFEKTKTEQRLWLSDSDKVVDDVLPVKLANNQLGKEFSLVIFDGQVNFNADAFAGILGTLKAGGLLIVLLSESLVHSNWLQRFLQCYQQHSSRFLHCQKQAQPSVSIEFQALSLTQQTATAEQQQAIAAICKVATGHRKRPLFLNADRGRGKSASLGMAAAELLKLGKKKILVTAPSRSQVATLFKHAQQQLENAEQQVHQLCWQDGEISFVAPDMLLQEQPSADLLIIDEAASIPLSLLEKILAAYSRVVFSTTVHGYEGTGRGFSVRFQKNLDKLTPNWRQLRLEKPIRWREDDILEQFSFDALLLDAEPENDLLLEQVIAEDCQFELIEQQTLSNDETLIREVFALMALAHYRTRPSDLQLLLDNDDVQLAIVKYQQQVIACAWLVAEPAMPKDLAEAVFQGRRKPKGHLLPQSLLLYSGIADAASIDYQRILRIAVHPTCQGKGIGSLLLDHIKQHCDSDMLGSSYALDKTVYQFWQKNDFHTVRLGSHADHVTGSSSIMMLMPLTENAQLIFQQAYTKFQQQWPYLLSRSLSSLDVETVCAVSTELYPLIENSDDIDLTELDSFAYQQRPYESVEVILWQWLTSQLGSAAFNQLTEQQQRILVLLVMQQQSLPSVVQSLALNGRAELIVLLRQAVKKML